MLLILLLIGTGWVTLRFVQQQKEHIVYRHTDPYTGVLRKDTTVLLEIPGAYEWNRIKSGALNRQPSALPDHLFPVIEALYPEDKNDPAGKTVIGFYPAGGIIWHPVKPGEKERIERRLRTLFSAFPPVKEKIGNTTLYHYPLEENRFFSCFIEEGLWCGAYNRKLLLESLSAYHRSAGLTADTSFIKARNRTEEFAQAHLFVRTPAINSFPNPPSPDCTYRWSAFDLNTESDKLRISGYLAIPEEPDGFDKDRDGLSFDPSAFSNRMTYGYSHLPTHSLWSRTDSFLPDSLLKTDSVISVNTSRFSFGDPAGRPQFIRAFRLRSPVAFRQKLSSLLNTDVQSGYVYTLPRAVRNDTSGNDTCIALYREYLFLSSSCDGIRQMLSDLQEGRNLTTLLPLSFWKQISPDAWIVAAGRASGFPFLENIPIPSSLVSFLRQTYILLEITPETPSQVYCNLYLFNLPASLSFR